MITQSQSSRRDLLRLAGATAVGATLAACTVTITPPTPQVTATPEPPVTNGEEALQRLMLGNQRYTAGQSIHPNENEMRRTEVAKGQKPFAVVLGCADSRVDPAILFDQGIGDLFVLRVAGNIVTECILGSIEFGVAEFGTPLVIVLGHEKCGAVNATIETIETGGEAPGHIGALVQALAPAVEAAKKQTGDLLENAIKTNVALMVDQLKTSTPILSESIAAGKLKIVGGQYDLDDGRVTITVS